MERAKYVGRETIFLFWKSPDSVADDAVEQQSGMTAGFTLGSSECDKPDAHDCSLKLNKRRLLEQEWRFKMGR